MISKFTRYFFVMSMFACVATQQAHGMLAAGFAAGKALLGLAGAPVFKAVGGYVVDKVAAQFITRSLTMVAGINQAAFDKLVNLSSQASNSSSESLDTEIKELLVAFHLIDENGNVSDLVKVMVSESIKTGSCACSCRSCCASICSLRACRSATLPLFKIGGILAAKSSIEFVHTALRNIQNHNGAALNKFVAACQNDEKGSAATLKNFAGLFQASHLIDEKGNIPGLVKQVVLNMLDTPADNADAPDAKRGTFGAGKPSQKVHKFLSIKDALKHGKIADSGKRLKLHNHDHKE